MRKNMVVFAPIRYLNRIYVVLSSISPLCQMSSLLNICAIWTNLSNLLQTKSHWLFTITLKIFHQKNSQFSQYKSSKYDHWPVYGIAYIQNMLDSIWVYTFFFRHRLRTPDINNKYNTSFVYDVLEYSIRSKDLFMKIKNLKWNHVMIFGIWWWC